MIHSTLSPSVSAVCVCTSVCVKGHSTGFSLTRLPSLFISLSCVQSCVRQRLCPVLSNTHASVCVFVYECVLRVGAALLCLLK